MPAHNYLIRYKDGSKKHVSREERDSLELRRVLKRTGPFSYECTLQPVTLHSLAELEKLNRTEETILRSFLEGQFTVVYADGSRRKERLETPEAMALRLERKGELVAA